MLAAAIFYGERRRDAQLRAQTNALVADLQRDRVTAIEISQPGQLSIKLRKQGALWELAAPLHYPAQTFAADYWLQMLEKANWVLKLTEAEIKAQGTTLAEFGLQPAQAMVTLQQGAQSIVVRLGHRLAVGRQFYVQVGDQPDVFITDGLLLERLPRTVTAWRDPAVLTFASIAVSNRLTFDRLEIRPASNGYTLQPDPANGRWRIMRPTAARGDASKINQLIGRLAQWQVSEFVTDDAATNLAEFGLQAPEQELVIGRGTNDLLVVQFGRSPTNRLDLVYARLLRHTNIVLTARTNTDILRLPFSFWRDRLLVALDTNRVQEIIGQANVTNFTYRVRHQTNGTWQVVEPEALPVDAELAALFFDQLNSIEVDFEKDVVMDFAPYGLAEPARQFAFLSLTNGGLTNLYPTLSFGTNLVGQTFARRSDESAVYLVRPGTFGTLPLAHWQWRDRAIWSFDTNDVRRVRITQHGQLREVLRSPEGKWTLAPGSTGALDLSFDEAVFRLSRLSVDRWVGRGDALREYFGFSNQLHQVAFEVFRQGVLQTNIIEFGGLSAEGRPFAMMRLDEGRPWYGWFPLSLYYEFVKRNFTLPERP